MGGKNGIPAPAPSIAVEEHLSEEEGAGKRGHVRGTAAKYAFFFFLSAVLFGSSGVLVPLALLLLLLHCPRP